MTRPPLLPPLTPEQQAVLDLLGRVEALELVLRRQLQDAQPDFSHRSFDPPARVPEFISRRVTPVRECMGVMSRHDLERRVAFRNGLTGRWEDAA